MAVGKSDRTLGKHILLQRLLDREIGVMNARNYNDKLAFLGNEYIMIDLCAGDGRPTPQSKKSSPMLMIEAACKLRKLDQDTYRKSQDIFINIILNEKNENTFDILNNTKLYEDCEKFNLDSTELESIKTNRQLRSSSTIFIHADPNAITDWPLNDNFVNCLPRNTTMLITLGCNVGGIKRLCLNDRQKWFDKMDAVLYNLNSWHDATLIVLNGDKAQWAYMIVGPKKWKDKYEVDAKKAFDYWGNGISIANFKSDPEKFFEMRNLLFLTKKERERAII